jgi:hypothetical protein
VGYVGSYALSCTKAHKGENGMEFLKNIGPSGLFSMMMHVINLYYDPSTTDKQAADLMIARQAIQTAISEYLNNKGMENN